MVDDFRLPNGYRFQRRNEKAVQLYSAAAPVTHAMGSAPCADLLERGIFGL